MRVRRTQEMKMKANEIRLGDVIAFKMKDGEKCEARAVKQDGDMMLMLFEDCLAQEYPMNEKGGTEGGYEASDLRRKLNTEILKRFPKKVRKHMQEFENGDLLRLLTKREVFGDNPYAEENEPETVEQIPAMKQRKNRVASQGLNGEYEWWWLQNRVSAAYFALVATFGNCYFDGASASLGVRPAFQIRVSSIQSGLDPDDAEQEVEV